MAVVSISRIQHRRGVRLDLPPNLNEAELGWCLDTRQLFIGNGNTYTGNSEILTQWSPNNELITHAYRGSSPVSAVGTVPRPLGSILDDYLNVKDYGAVGDGFTDDTDAIQAAIADEWARIASLPYSPYLSRNTIYFPAGNYLISSSINLYPYTTLAGEGVNRTQLTMASGYTGPMLRTADSLGQTGGNIGTNGASLPTSITVRGMNIDNSNGGANPVVMLQRCSGVTLSSCKIVNTWTPGSGPLSGIDGISIESLGTVVNTGDIYIVGTSIKNCSTAITMSDPIRRVYIQDGNIYNSNTGILAGTGIDGGVDSVWIQGCSFRDIDDIAILADTVGSVSSIGNNFANIVSYSISWTNMCTLCQSIGDIFEQATVGGFVSNGNPGYNLVFDVQQTQVVNNQPIPYQVGILPGQAGTATGITFDLSNVAISFTAFLDYSVSLDSYSRAGRLSIISNGVTASISDTGVDLNATESVTFSVSIAGSVLSIDYSSTGTSAGIMSYIQTTWTN